MSQNSIERYKRRGKDLIFMLFLAAQVFIIFNLINRSVRNSDNIETNIQISENIEIQNKDVKFTAIPPIVSEADFSNSFHNLQGTAVLYNAGRNQYYIYNPQLSIVRTSPCETFRIVTTLIGLNTGIFNTETPEEDLKTGLPLEYIGKDAVQELLDQLEYGNCNINVRLNRNKADNEEQPDFWMNSTLKISAEEQVVLLARLFEEMSVFSKEDIHAVKKIMKKETVNGDIKLYGETGEGQNNAWYVGIAENSNNTWYIAVRLEESTGEMAMAIIKDILVSNPEIFF